MATENRDGLRRAIAAILEESPLALAELIERLDAGHLLEALLDRIGRDALTAVVSQEVFSIDQCWVTGSGVAGRTDALLDGLVLTHRLSEEEVTTERVRCWPDLVVLDWDADDGLELRTGGQLAVELEYRGTHRDGSVLCGPPGWLHDAVAGDLLAFVRSEDAVGVEVVGTAPSPDQREVAALRAGVESWLAAGEGDELAPMMIDALVLDPGSFRRAVRPLGELAVDAGLECRGFSFGRRGEHWSTRAERYEAEERREAAEGLASCCRERFEVLCDTFVAYRDGEDFDSGAIRSDLAHGDVLAAFANYAPSWDALLGFAQTLAETAPGDARVQFLLGLAAEDDDAVHAEARFRAALEVDPEVAPAAEALARCEIDRGHFDAALALLARPGMDPEHPTRSFLEDLLAEPAPFAGTGRNEPCPCGSGKKYKLCHLGSRRPWLDDPLALVSLKLSLDAERRQSFINLVYELAEVAGPGVSSDPDGFPDDRVIWDLATIEAGLAEEYLTSRGALLPAEERDLLRQIIDEPRRLFEVIDVGHEDLRLREDGQSNQTLALHGLRVADVSKGDGLLARMLRVNGVPSLVGAAVRVPASQMEPTRVLLRQGPGDEELARWYGELRRIAPSVAGAGHLS